MNCISGHSGPLGNSWVVPVGALAGDGIRLLIHHGLLYSLSLLLDKC